MKLACKCCRLWLDGLLVSIRRSFDTSKGEEYKREMNMDKQVLSVGEIMMRLQPPKCDRIRQACSFDIAYGGGEANVAVCMAQLGDKAKFFTKLPDNEIGKACEGELRKFGVNTENIIYGGERMGIYFCEKGYSERPSRVIYDRKYSSFSACTYHELDNDKLLENVGWLHFTGITPALSQTCAEMTEYLLKAAKNRGITVSCDLNYRAKLWSESKAREVMSNLMQYVDVVVANEEDAKKVFGIQAQDTDIESGHINADGYKSVCHQIEDLFGVHTIAITLRESFSANRNGWSAVLYREGEFYHSRRYDINVLDRVGGGDSFCGGLIHALCNDYDSAQALEYAVACSCLKHSVNGDFHIISDSEVLSLMASSGNGRVER